ncbi:MAG: hypothetical protein WC755_07520, partial [Candidatus Woesearchaeota archaeon]
MALSILGFIKRIRGGIFNWPFFKNDNIQSDAKIDLDAIYQLVQIFKEYIFGNAIYALGTYLFYFGLYSGIINYHINDMIFRYFIVVAIFGGVIVMLARLPFLSFDILIGNDSYLAETEYRNTMRAYTKDEQQTKSSQRKISFRPFRERPEVLPVIKTTGKQYYKVFISSTYEDMHYERDLLMYIVWPQIKIFARRYGKFIDFIDYRWGIDNRL